MMPILALLTYLLGNSRKVNSLVPSQMSSGLTGVFLTMLTKRLVLLAILIGMTMFGSHKLEAQAALNEYVYKGLDINTPTKSSSITKTDADPLTSKKESTSSDPADW